MIRIKEIRICCSERLSKNDGEIDILKARRS